MTYSGRVGAGVFLTSLSLLTTELVLTRIFSVIVWYHFAFFAISVALFGTGAAALLVHLIQRRLATDRTSDTLCRAAWGLAVVTAGVDLVLVNATPDWFAGRTEFTALTLKLVAVFALAAAPFAVGGFVLSLVMTRCARSIHRVYFWDLAGAGTGCLLVVVLLAAVGGPLALLGSSLLAASAAIAFSGGARRPGRAHAITAGVVLAIVAVGALDPVLGWMRIRVAKGRSLEQGAPEYVGWNSFSMVTVFPELDFRGWGVSPRYRGPVPEQKSLIIDMSAMTTLTRFDGSLDDVRYAANDLSALVYRLVADPKNVCVIGAGGGKDVLAALAGGAGQVTAVEINPLIVEDVVRGRYRDFTGALYDRDDVTVVVEDGRSFVRRTDQRFDVLLLSMVDTSAATAAGAYSLTENSLYTTDAFEDFASHLEPEGVLSVSTVSLEGLAVGARLVAIAREALERLGQNPARSIAVVETPWLGIDGAVLYDVLVKPSGFSPEEADRLGRATGELGFSPVYLPGRALPLRRPESAWIARIATSPDEAALEKWMKTLPIDVSAVTDDRPYFFYQDRFADFLRALVSVKASHLFGNGLAIVAKVLLVALLFVGIFVGVPLLSRHRELRAGAGAVGADLAYVACLGLGFMFVEIALLQRFSLYLGQPTYTLAVVLCVLLVAGGLGSRLLAAVPTARAGRVLTIALAGVIGYGTLTGLGAEWLFERTLAWPAPARAAVAAGVIAPMGFVMGMPLPAGLRAVATAAGSRIPWLFGINSATSVLGSILATVVSLNAGIGASLAGGLALYLGALLLWPRVWGRERVA